MEGGNGLRNWLNLDSFIVNQFIKTQISGWMKYPDSNPDSDLTDSFI